jgi:hypothetical protein
MMGVEESIQKQSRGALRATALTTNSLPSHDANHWLGSALQHEFLDKLNAISSRIRRQEHSPLLPAWRNLFDINNFAHLHIRHYTEDSHGLSHLPNPYDVSLSLFNIIEDMTNALCQLEKENPAYCSAARAAMSMAIGTRNEEQLT